MVPRILGILLRVEVSLQSHLHLHKAGFPLTISASTFLSSYKDISHWIRARFGVERMVKGWKSTDFKWHEWEGALFNPVRSPVPAVGKGKLTPQEHVSEAKWERAVLPYALLIHTCALLLPPTAWPKDAS